MGKILNSHLDTAFGGSKVFVSSVLLDHLHLSAQRMLSRFSHLEATQRKRNLKKITIFLNLS